MQTGLFRPHSQTRSKLTGKLVGMVFASAQLWAFGQTAPPPTSGIGTTAPFTLHVTTREVVVDVVARDRDNHPVNDLTESELHVFELARRSPKLPRKISSFHLVDPASDQTQSGAPSGGFRITLGGGCAISTTFHYQLHFSPQPTVGRADTTRSSSPPPAST
jgi:hypothetical protein